MMVRMKMSEVWQGVKMVNWMYVCHWNRWLLAQDRGRAAESECRQRGEERESNFVEDNMA